MPSNNTETLITSALSKVKHRNPELTKRDLQQCLHHYRGLIPKPDKFIFNDGANRDMINILGTIPVPYKGHNYNIPVSLWLLETHPYHAPICYVKPTTDMQIKFSKHVDQSGKIYLPYLHEWAHNKSDLLGLIQILIITFSEQPPVYSRPKSQETSQQQPHPAVNYPVYPSTMYPGGYGGQYNAGYSGPFYGPVAGVNPPAGQQQVYTPPPQAQEENTSGPALRQVEEEVRGRLREEIARKQAETDQLVSVGEKLSEGNSRLSVITSRLQQELAETESSLDLLRQKTEEMKVTKERLGQSLSQLDCNEAVTATAPLFTQLIEAHAE